MPWIKNITKLILFFLLMFSVELLSDETTKISQEKASVPFECPHQCGAWGSTSLLSVEWDFVLVLHYVNQLISTTYYENEWTTVWNPDIR
ncbi:MAG: hypothetical protein KDK71_00895, partial [Chlamydiia bacterium]|nr:hypothetical protein [Chlamydiia bacterium]